METFEAREFLIRRWDTLASSADTADTHAIFQTVRGYESYLDKSYEKMSDFQRTQMCSEILYLQHLIHENELTDPSRLRRVGYAMMQLFSPHIQQ